MPLSLRAGLVALIALSPAAALAQMVVQEPPMMEDPGMPMPMMVYSGPLSAQDAADVAMQNGMVTVDDVDQDDDDGTFTVEGEDATGDDVAFVIDGMSGEILSMDD